MDVYELEELVGTVCEELCKFRDSCNEEHKCWYMRTHNGECPLDKLTGVIQRGNEIKDIQSVVTACEKWQNARITIVEKNNYKQFAYEKIRKIVESEE